MLHYRAPRWLGADSVSGGNLQTIWPALFSRRHGGAAPRFERERWTTPDGDFIDLDWQRAPQPAPPRERRLLVLFHGLEGSSASHYAQAFADEARTPRLGFRRAAFPRLLGRDQSGAARLPFG